MKIKMEVEIDNASWKENPGKEVTRLCESLLTFYHNGYLYKSNRRNLYDLYGNLEGFIKVYKQKPYRAV